MKGYSLHNRTAEHCGPIELTSAHATNCLRSGFEAPPGLKLVQQWGKEAAFQPFKRTAKKSKQQPWQLLDSKAITSDWEVLCHGRLGGS